MGEFLLACVLTAAQAYLIGSIVFGVLIAKVFFHDDVRTHGSGSAGMTNMIRNYGKAAGAATAVCDILKGVAAVCIGRAIFAVLGAQSGFAPVCGAYLAGIFATLGHTKPILFHFRGGKGVLVGGGAVLATEPLVFLMLLVVFLIEFAITHIVSLGSILIALLYPVATTLYWVYRGMDVRSILFIAVCTLGMTAQVVYMHKENIQRLKSGTEYRFGEKKDHSK